MGVVCGGDVWVFGGCLESVSEGVGDVCVICWEVLRGKHW